MKKIIFSFLSLAMIALLVSCEEDTTRDISRITYFPTFEISNGPQTDLVEAGGDYAEPTAIATEGGVEIDNTTSISGKYSGATSFDVNVADEYTFSFTALNSDGYPGSASKIAIVYATGDMTTSLEGLYIMSVTRAEGAYPEETHADMEYAMVTKESDNLFNVSHGIGGFYSDGRGYGDNYRCQGMQVQVNDMAANDFTFPNGNGVVPGWGIGGEASNMVVDAAAKTIQWDADWAGYSLHVTLTQYQP